MELARRPKPLNHMKSKYWVLLQLPWTWNGEKSSAFLDYVDQGSQQNHLLMYLAGNYCYRINAIAPPAGERRGSRGTNSPLKIT